MDQRGLIVTRSARLRVSLIRKTKWPMSAVIHSVNVPVTRASAAPLTAACTSVGLHFSWAASAQKITSAQSHERITRPTHDTSPFCPLSQARFCLWLSADWAISAQLQPQPSSRSSIHLYPQTFDSHTFFPFHCASPLTGLHLSISYTFLGWASPAVVSTDP